MSKREDNAYAEWLGELKAKNPAIADKLDEIADTEAGREIFRGSLREADYYQRVEKVNAKEKELLAEDERQVSWWKEAKPEYDRAVQEAAEARRRLEAVGSQVSGGNPPAPPHIQPSKDLEELKSRVVAMDQGYGQLMLGMFNAQQAALREGLPFEADKVLQEVYQQKVDPVTAFNKLAAPARETKAKELLDRELEKAREEGYKQALSKLSGPDKVLRQGGTSLVDTLKASQDPSFADSRQRVDASVKDWLELENSGSL